MTGCGGTLDGNTYTTGAITADCAVTASFRETDSDGDGIDDAWEEYWFGGLTTADAKSDYDKDGYSDLQEYLNALAGQNDPAGAPYDPKVKNAPGGTGYQNPMGVAACRQAAAEALTTIGAKGGSRAALCFSLSAMSL